MKEEVIHSLVTSFCIRYSQSIIHVCVFLYFLSSLHFCDQQSQCKFMPDRIGAQMTGVLHIERGNEHALLAAVATVGPVSVSVDASPNTFRVGTT